MSLLNQVLQDLEKRNVETPLKQKSAKRIKKASSQHKLPLYLTLLLLLAGIIAAAFYFFNDKGSSEKVIQEFTPVVSSTSQPKQNIIEPKVDPVTVIVSEQAAIKIDAQPLVTHKVNKAAVNQPIAPPVPDKKIQQKPVKTPPKKIAKAKNKPYKLKRLPKKLTPNQQANKYFLLAKKQTNNGEQQEKLEQTLQLNPKHIEARLLLANSLLNRGMLNETIAVLDQGLKLSPQNLQFINFRSQLLLQNKQPQAALKTLQQINSAYIQDEMYLSLLAAAYQQNKDHQNSLQIYQKLLSINPQKAEYWLGLAIAQEKLGNTTQALTAYQYALNKKTLKITIVNYINQRVSLLK